MKNLLMSFLGAGLVLALAACNKLEVIVSFQDENILAINSNKYYVEAIGSKRLYLLAGEKKIIINGKTKLLLPGNCYQLSDGKLYGFYLHGFISTFGSRYPELKQDRVMKASAIQFSILKKEEKRPELNFGTL